MTMPSNANAKGLAKNAAYTAFGVILGGAFATAMSASAIRYGHQPGVAIGIFFPGLLAATTALSWDGLTTAKRALRTGAVGGLVAGYAAYGSYTPLFS